MASGSATAIRTAGVMAGEGESVGSVRRDWGLNEGSAGTRGSAAEGALIGVAAASSGGLYVGAVFLACPVQ